ncbi:MAG: peptide ABC transporter permease [Bdellovibrionales bacterium RBG_16_40_8]|nr:MAG: peptide ABC transporter permease [Bdellovibrionales bacterium RBG_16_40_8]
MARYLARRLFMMVPTLFGVTILSFVIINLAPGSPVEQKLQQMRWSGAMGSGASAAGGSSRMGEAKVSAEVLEALNKQYGFDKPLLTRYAIWLKNIVTLDFGTSFTYDEPVIDVIVSKFPVSIQFGVLSLILTYIVCIPLGITKAIKNNSFFDATSSFFLFIIYSIPPLMLGVLLMVFFAGGSYFNWFPIAGISSENYDLLTFMGKVIDRAHHFILPLICYMVNSFTVLTMLMKNTLLDEVKLDYVRTARAKGLDEKVVVLKHALRNALIPLVTGIGGFLGIFLGGSMIIETLFSLDGIGLLGYKSALSRDYNVLMALIFISSLVSLLGRLISDLLYLVVDPRIDFN